jgi:hypothetical protein
VRRFGVIWISEEPFYLVDESLAHPAACLKSVASQFNLELSSARLPMSYHSVWEGVSSK